MLSELLEKLEYEEVIRIYNGNVEVQKDIKIVAIIISMLLWADDYNLF